VKRLFLVALGNPGRDYQNTRHNIAWLFLDTLLQNERTSLAPGKGRYFIGQKGRTYYIKPSTFMNNSGVAVRDIVDRYEVNVSEELLILCDDVNLPFGKLRLRLRGSSGGHRGLESILFQLATEEFPRLRFGVDRAPEIPLRDYVLSSMSSKELERLRDVFHRAEEGLRIYGESGGQDAMNFLNASPDPDEPST
jgi:PTH1 family peptidyl-tRNA hydrolase